MKKCFIILGMHRSGTSVTTGILSHFDLALGQDLIKPNDENPRGFFENRAILALNKKILRECNSNWDDHHFDIKDHNKNKIDSWTEEALQILKSEFTEHNIFAIKDPRICLLFPVWEQALITFNTKIKVIISYRNPAAVAHSLKTRNDFQHSKSILLWANYFIALEKFSRHYERLYLNYPTDFLNSTSLLSIIKKFTQLEISDSNKKSALAFYDKSLTRHQSENNQIIDTPPLFRRFIKHIEINGIENIRKNNNFSKEFKSFLNFFSDKELIDTKNRQLNRKSSILRRRDDRIARLDSDIEELEGLIVKKIETKNLEITALANKLLELKDTIINHSNSTSDYVNAYLQDRENIAWLKGMYKHKKDKRLLQRINRIQCRTRKTLNDYFSVPQK